MKCSNCKYWEHKEYLENDRSPNLKLGYCFQFDKWDADNGFDFREDKYSYVEYNGNMDGPSPIITSEKFFCAKFDERIKKENKTEKKVDPESKLMNAFNHLLPEEKKSANLKDYFDAFIPKKDEKT